MSGYNLDALAGTAVLKPWPAARRPGLHQLVVGSEGTLAVVAEAELDLVPRPKARGLLVPQFDTLAAALDALAACLELGPSAVELMDHMLLDLTARQPRRCARRRWPHRRPAGRRCSWSSSPATTPAEVADRVEKLRRRLQGVDGADRPRCRRSTRPCATRCGTCAARRCRCCTACPATASR